MDRVRRNVPRRDYARLHHGQELKESSLEGDGLQITVNNSQIEDELDFSEEIEEGEVEDMETDESSLSDSWLDSEINKALKDCDSDRAQSLLDEKE